jgi:hypothetical protein
MINAKKEILELLDQKKIICANIRFCALTNKEESRNITLKVNYNRADYIRFFNSLDFDYEDKAYSAQQLFGVIWFNNNTWAERYTNEIYEAWTIFKKPDIPINLK